MNSMKHFGYACLVALFFLGCVIVLASMVKADPVPDQPNRVEIVAGYGQDGLTYRRAGTAVQISPYMGPLAGLRYSRTEGLGAASFEVLGGQSGSYVVAVGLGRNF